LSGCPGFVVPSVRAEVRFARLDAHRETTACHAENLHELGDLAAQRRCGALARLRQAIRRRRVLALQSGQSALEFRQAAFGVR